MTANLSSKLFILKLAGAQLFLWVEASTSRVVDTVDCKTNVNVTKSHSEPPALAPLL